MTTCVLSVPSHYSLGSKLELFAQFLGREGVTLDKLCSRFMLQGWFFLIKQNIPQSCLVIKVSLPCFRVFLLSLPSFLPLLMLLVFLFVVCLFVFETWSIAQVDPKLIT